MMRRMSQDEMSKSAASWIPGAMDVMIMYTDIKKRTLLSSMMIATSMSQYFKFLRVALFIFVVICVLRRIEFFRSKI